MFDGNHRSRRQRPAPRRRKASDSATDNRQALLERTAALRQQRHAAQQQQQAALKLQRCCRGFLDRRRVWHHVCVQQLNSVSRQQQQLSLVQHTRLLNFALSFQYTMNKKSNNNKEDWLTAWLHHWNPATPSTIADPLWVHRIVEQALLGMLPENDTVSTDVAWQVWNTLHTAAVPSLVLFGSASSTSAAADTTALGILTLAKVTLATQNQQLYQHLLAHTSSSSSSPPSNNAMDLAYLVGWALGFMDVNNASHLQTLDAVVKVCVSQHVQATTWWQALHPYLSIPRILRHALPAVGALPLILHYWQTQEQLFRVWTLTRAKVLGQTDTISASANALQDDEDDDSESESDDAAGAQAGVSVGATTSNTSLPLQDSQTWAAASRRLTKSQISTVAHLDRLAKVATITSSATRQITNYTEDEVWLSNRLADPMLWKQWSQVCLVSQQPDTNTASQRAIDYVQALALLVPTRLHTRMTARSPLLMQLAFDATFVTNFWFWLQWQNTPASTPNFAAWTVFSNILSQRLLVMKDDEFLAQYASSPSSSSSTTNNIRILDVIAVLKPILYQLYWTTPVQVDDVTRNFHADRPPVDYAAHCLLAGTKLYNAVYQRWCRMVRSPRNFAPEELWWFPSLSTTGTRVQLDNQSMQESDSDSNDEDNDPMDLSPEDMEAEALAASFDDPRLSRILTSIPQALPFDKRVKLFDSLVKADKVRTQDEVALAQNAIAAMIRGEDGRTGRQNVEIRREYLYQDAMQQLNQLGPKLRQKVQVSFINQHGAAEAGIDGGGVFKEFLDDLVKEAFSFESTSEATSSNTLPLFAVTPMETLAINLDYAHRPDLLSHYEFLGRAIGKAVYEGILVDPQFCLPFLNQLLGKSNSLEDLKNYDPEYYKNLVKLLSLDASAFDTLGLTFEVSVGKAGRTVNLQPGGSQRAVTSQNVIPYAHLVAHQLLNVQSDKPVKAFLRGFRDLIPAPWVRLFAAHELQKIISGDDGRLDVASFKATMQYAAGYHPSQPIVRWFWEIVEKDLTPEQQCKLLKFMTSCSRQPLLGFSSLEPAPCVQQIRLSDALFQQDPADILKKAPLPTSSTCMNLLKLPNYRSKELMRVKLIAAIESGAGFELT